MKMASRLFLVLCLSCVLGLAAMVANAHDCTCTSPAGNCGANASCAGGCYAICGSGGCTSGCSGGGGGPLPKAYEGPRVTLSAEGLSLADLQDGISDQLGQRFLFVASKTAAPFNVSFHDATPADVLHGFSKLGAALVLTDDRGPRQKGVGGLRVSLKAEDIDLEAVAQVLEEALGEGFNIRLLSKGELVSVDLRDIELAEVRQALSRFAGIRVEVERPER